MTVIQHHFTEALDVDGEDEFQLMTKAVNDSICPEGLVPTLLLLGAPSRYGAFTDKPSPSTHRRALALRKVAASTC